VPFKRSDGSAETRRGDTKSVTRGVKSTRIDDRDKSHQFLKQVGQIIHLDVIL
jgi:hypothetical protein